MYVWSGETIFILICVCASVYFKCVCVFGWWWRCGKHIFKFENCNTSQSLLRTSNSRSHFWSSHSYIRLQYSVQISCNSSAKYENSVFNLIQFSIHLPGGLHEFLLDFFSFVLKIFGYSCGGTPKNQITQVRDTHTHTTTNGFYFVYNIKQQSHCSRKLYEKKTIAGRCGLRCFLFYKNVDINRHWAKFVFLVIPIEGMQRLIGIGVCIGHMYLQGKI